jgi:hypothetical protein
VLDGLFKGFFCNLDILYGGLGRGKLQFLISAVIFFQFLVIKALDPDWIRIGLQPQNAGSGSGSNECGSETLALISIPFFTAAFY